MSSTPDDHKVINFNSPEISKLSNQLSDIWSSVGNFSLPEVPRYEPLHNLIDNTQLDEAMREIHEQREGEVRDRKKAIELQEEQNELLLQNNQLLQNIDSNTLSVVESMHKLVDSQYATEAIQSEMLEIMRQANEQGDFWANIKTEIPSILMSKGADYLVAFIVSAFQYAINSGIQ